MAQFSEQDLILLNSYLDGRLAGSERAALEKRLEQDAALRDEMETLRATIGLLKMAERVPVPRSFTLDPAVYGRPARRSFLEMIGLGAMPSWALGTAALAVVILCIGALIAGGVFGGSATQIASNASAPMAAEATEAVTEAPAATEAAAEVPAATEAPTEAGTPESTENQMFSAQMATESPTSKLAPVAPPQAGLSTPEAATSGSGGSGAEPGVAQVTAPPTEAHDNVTVQQDGASRLTLSGTPAPYSTIEITEAAPWDNLKPGSWGVLLGGTVLLIGLVLGVTFLLRRRQ